MEYVINHGWAPLLIQARETQFKPLQKLLDSHTKSPILKIEECWQYFAALIDWY